MASDSLLISGSRDATKAMLDYAFRAVERAGERGWQIVVGDAPGIDQAVIDACNLFDVRCEIYGAKSSIRARVHPGQTTMALPTRSYRVRDQDMVNHADYVLCLWNGRSRGTRYVYEFATAAPGPKQVWLRRFD